MGRVVDFGTPDGSGNVAIPGRIGTSPGWIPRTLEVGHLPAYSFSGALWALLPNVLRHLHLELRI